MENLERISSPYYVVTEHSLGELINEVERFMVAGWKPLGGIAIGAPETETRFASYYQAVVR